MPHHPPPRALFLLPCCVLLARCAPASEPVVVKAAVPPSLLTCAPPPPAPDLGGRRWDEALADYLLDLAAAGDDCRAKLNAVGKLVQADRAPPGKDGAAGGD